MVATQMKRKILLIDDDPNITTAVRSRLESADYDVDIAHSGKEGLEKVENFKPNLIVLDVMMEDVTGYEVCATLKDNAKNKHIPIIMLTSRVKSIDENLGYACHADAYIRKPQSSELLIPEIKKLLKDNLPEGESCDA